MNVLSLFDGMSCGQLALNRAGFKIENYFACEIDKYAIQITQANYPNTQQLGDVTKVSALDLPALDLVIGGSPCQGFSFAGRQLNFEDPRSKLFFEFVRLFKEARVKNPSVKFLLENVKMKKEYQDVISQYLGVEPIEINSALVSAQNRKRLYWSNLEGIEQPEDKSVLLRDIIVSGKVDRDKSLCLTQRYYGFQGSQSYLRRRYFGKAMGQAVFENVEPILQKAFFKNTPFEETDQLGYIRSLSKLECERLQTVPEGYTDKASIYESKRMLGNGWTVDVIVHILQSDLSL